jgi:isoleucyl-tRNA synthetase
VGFEQSEPGEWRVRGVPEGVEVAIWTTTPWTLPANLAVALNPGETYLVVESTGRRFLVAERRAGDFVENACGGQGRVVEGTSVRGSSLEGLGLVHPLFDDRTSTVILAEHVTMDDGTGCVHTAPGHGAEDFAAGQRYGLDTFSPVDARGVFTEGAGRYSGLAVGRANPVIVEDLRTSGRLIADRRVEHSYPHCWRCKQPLIFRATRQFFLDLSHDRLRERVLESVDSISWHPSWGYDRMKNMMAARPDWCLSRQRSWGVALPAFICRGCGTALLDPDVIEAAAGLVAREGSDAWFTTSPEEIFASARRTPVCASCGGASLDRVDDILDVWFDSSLSHYCVLDGGFGLERPASVYLEATDQHRGWFGVSLITSTGLDLGIPARNIVTHGLILDKQGKKMSKSLGNVVSPLEIVETMGADILRLWFAGVDYTADFRADKAMLDDAREAYRKLRNTLRFMLGNLGGGPRVFDPSALVGLDRFIWLRFRQVGAKCVEEYKAFQFHRVYRELRNLATIDLSGLFLDIRKDRLYCDAPDDPRTASTRGLLGWMTVELIKLLAPLIPFTADEAWGELPEDLRTCASAHLALLVPDPLSATEEQELASWDVLLEVRRAALKALEDARAAGRIGSGLDAEVELSVPAGHLDSAGGEDWADFLIVSGVRVRPSEEVSVEVAPSSSPKCARCWKLKPETGSGRFPDVCGRCGGVLERAGADER